MAHAGAIRPLVKLLKDDAPSVREEAAAALGNLVFFNDETNAGNQAPMQMDDIRYQYINLCSRLAHRLYKLYRRFLSDSPS